MDTVLADLPRGYHALDYGDAVIVFGPTGAFALATDDADIDSAAHRAAEAALEVRDRLCQALSWAPFVDALVVVDSTCGHTAEATLVPRRRLRDVLTAGGVCLRDRDIGRMLRALST